jgi:quercetin dioxygenase-like cupin family protein
MATTQPQVGQLYSGEWQEHARFPGIYLKHLVSPRENPLAIVNGLRVPPGGVIGRHHHPAEIEMVYVVSGQCVLTLDEDERPLTAGDIVAIPAGLVHSLRNAGAVLVELLAIFTPPLA